MFRSNKLNRILSGIGAAWLMLSSLATPVMASGVGFGNFWAVITDPGVIARSSGVVNSSRIGAGIYVVTFARPLNRCVWTTSILGNTPSFVSAARSNAAKPASLYVYTFSANGTPANRGFNVIVDCQG